MCLSFQTWLSIAIGCDLQIGTEQLAAPIWSIVLTASTQEGNTLRALEVRQAICGKGVTACFAVPPCLLLTCLALVGIS
jgi:hypothetical protein